MALTAKKTVMLEKQYLYVKASKGFQLEGTNIEKIWTNTGYYRFLVDNVAKALSNSYVNIWYDPSDIDFIAYCSDLFMEELQNTVVVAVENLQSYVEQFYDRNHEDITELSEGLSASMQILVQKSLISEFSPYSVLNITVGFYSNVNLDVGDSSCFLCTSRYVTSASGYLSNGGLYFANYGVYLILFPNGNVQCFNARSVSPYWDTPCEGCLIKVVRVS